MGSMNSTASLVMAVVVNDGNEDRENPDFPQAHKRKRGFSGVP